MSDTPDKKLGGLEEMMEMVKVSRDFFVGSSKVLNKDYLPQLDREDDCKYEKRKEATTFSNLYNPLIKSLVGRITKKEPTVEGFEKLIDLNNVDREGNSFSNFVKKVCESSLVAGVEFVHIKSIDNELYLGRYKYEQLYSYLIKDEKLVQIVFRKKHGQTKHYKISEAK